MTLRSMMMTAPLILAVGLQAGPVSAGSQLLCRQYEIGSEPSLPWKTNQWWGTPDPDYPRARLVDDTLALLTPDQPVLARMETLRRAAQYAKERARGQELLARLMARVLDAEARQAKDALAWFDVGYLSATFELSGEPVPLPGLRGYDWVARALAHRADPEMQFAAALIRRESPEKPGAHLPLAYAGAEPGSRLARNLTAAFGTRRPAVARK